MLVFVTRDLAQDPSDVLHEYYRVPSEPSLIGLMSMHTQIKAICKASLVYLSTAADVKRAWFDYIIHLDLLTPRAICRPTDERRQDYPVDHKNIHLYFTNPRAISSDWPALARTGSQNNTGSLVGLQAMAASLRNSVSPELPCLPVKEACGARA